MAGWKMPPPPTPHLHVSKLSAVSAAPLPPPYKIWVPALHMFKIEEANETEH